MTRFSQECLPSDRSKWLLSVSGFVRLPCRPAPSWLGSVHGPFSGHIIKETVWPSLLILAGSRLLQACLPGAEPAASTSGGGEDGPDSGLSGSHSGSTPVPSFSATGLYYQTHCALYIYALNPCPFGTPVMRFGLPEPSSSFFFGQDGPREVCAWVLAHDWKLSCPETGLGICKGASAAAPSTNNIKQNKAKTRRERDSGTDGRNTAQSAGLDPPGPGARSVRVGQRRKSTSPETGASLGGWSWDDPIPVCEESTSIHTYCSTQKLTPGEPSM